MENKWRWGDIEIINVNLHKTSPQVEFHIANKTPKCYLLDKIVQLEIMDGRFIGENTITNLPEGLVSGGCFWREFYWDDAEIPIDLTVNPSGEYIPRPFNYFINTKTNNVVKEKLEELVENIKEEKGAKHKPQIGVIYNPEFSHAIKNAGRKSGLEIQQYK